MRKQTARLALLLVTFLSLLQVAFAQNRTVTGRVTDPQGAGVPGVTITVRGTNNATQSGNDGSFTIQAPENGTLVFTAVGFGTKEASASSTTVNVALETAASNLNEVVVVGYGTARRRDVTGSVATVRAKDFNKGVQTSPDQLIQGKAAGVMVINNSGQPGGATTVRIRGTSSIRSGNQPLFVVDGVILPGGNARPGGGEAGIGASPAGNPLTFMNPNDIASIEILKDASATAIYGSRGANGVILITTKRGLSGQPVIEGYAATGISTIMKRLEVLNAQEYVQALKDYNMPTTVWTQATPTANFGGSVDALDAVMQTANTHNYSVAVGGGTENGRYRLSASYLNQEGIIRESGLKRYTANLSSNFRFLNSRRLGLDFNLTAAGTNEQIAPVSSNAGFTGSLVGQALQWNPTHPLTRPGMDSAWIDPAVGSTTINPLAMLQAHDDRANVGTIIGSITPYFKITNDLEYRFQYSLNRSFGVRRFQLARWINFQGIENRGTAGINNAEELTQQFTNTLSYNKEINQNFNLNAVVGHEYLNLDNRGHGLGALDFVDVGLNYYDFIGYGTQASRGIYSYASPTTELQSFFGRAIVNLYDKYIITGTMRADGSTRFGANKKYGYFPSLAVAWNASNEGFLRDNNVFSNLKFRLGWGATGNQEFASGASLNRFIFVRQDEIRQTNYGNPDLQWETSNTTNAGVDFGIFRDRITGTVDYFYKKSGDVLYEQTLVAPAPPGRIWINLPGNIINSGVEVSLNGGIIRGNDLNWNLGVNASFLKNEVTGLRPGEVYETGGLSGQGISGTTSQRIINNQPLNVFYLRRFQGIDKTSGQSVYEDEGNTLYYVGSPNPKMLLGISTDLSYKRLSASVNMNGAFGHYLYNNTANTVLPIGNLGTRNIAKSLIGTGIKENATNAIAASTRYLEKGDYLKLANATISYNLGNIGNTFRNAAISLTGQNLFVITKYSGFDPEVNTNAGVGGIPSLGIEYTPYPSARTILLGVNFSF